MDAVLTILIWLGSGFAFSVGVLCGVSIAGRLRKGDADINVKSLEEMRHRNAIGEQQVAALNRIANAAEVTNAN